MSIIGSVVGAGIGAAGSIFGGNKASQAIKAARNRIKGELADNESWYNRNYNEDVTQRADAQKLLQMTEESIRNRNRAAAGTQAVMGGTEESTQATKTANAEAAAEAVSRIAAAGDARKERVDSQYQSNKRVLDDQLNGLDAQKAQNIGNVTSGLAGTAAQLGSAIDDYLDNNDKGAK